MRRLKHKRIVAEIIAIAMMALLTGCDEKKSSEGTEIYVTEKNKEESSSLTEKESGYDIETKNVEGKNDRLETKIYEDKNISGMNEVQKNSIEMLNYLTVLAEKVHQSTNSKLFLESVTNSLLNDLYPNAIDKRTQTYISNMLQNINELRMIDVKRERLAFLYEQNKAMAMKNAIPSPISLLNVVESTNPLKMVASITYMAVDAYNSYTSASTEDELSYLKNGWELSDSEDETINDNRIEAFNYMQDIIRDNKLDGDLALNENAVNRFVEWENDTNVVSRIQHLESEQNVYAAYGEYWILLAKSYYENNNYSGCVSAVEMYLQTQARIFRKDTELASILPFAITSVAEIYYGNELVKMEKKYVELLDKNTDSSKWELKYFSALTYLDLYARSKENTYLQEAYRIIKDNVNELYKDQLNLNDTYLAAVTAKEIPENSTKSEKKEIEQYNKMIKEMRKTELPPIDNALFINLQLLFSLGDKMDISISEKEELNNILHQNGKKLYLSSVLDNFFWYGNQDDIEKKGSFDKRVLTIPASYVNDNSKIIVTHYGKEKTIYEDWKVSAVERPKKSNDVNDFKVIYKSKMIDNAKIKNGDKISVQIYPYGDEFEPIELLFVAHENKIARIKVGFDYELFDE